MNTSKLTIKRLETSLKNYSGSESNHEVQGSSTPAAVSVLFNITNGEPCVLMIKRATSLSHHSGEWAFPGGLIDETDDSAMHAALRETNEELGIDPDDIEIWCAMAPVDTSTGFVVWPYAGRVGDEIVYKPEPAEVAEAINIPVRIFVDDVSKRTITLIRNGTTRKINAYAYEDRIIWGASARIIANTIDIVTDVA